MEILIAAIVIVFVFIICFVIFAEVLKGIIATGIVRGYEQIKRIKEQEDANGTHEETIDDLLNLLNQKKNG